MNRLRQLLMIALLLVLVAGLGFGALAQDGAGAGATATPTDLHGTSFEVVYEIGRALPQSLIYDPNFERYAVINAYGQLELIDARTYQTTHILYNEGAYNGMAFSHDGRWLALAIGARIELWDAAAGSKVADMEDMEVSQARRIHGPLVFSEDDSVLLFNGTYPAPAALRRTENDTTTVPWLWHLPTARREAGAVSGYPNGLEAVAFFDYRNGFVIGPDNRVVAALPGRLHVIDGLTGAVLYEIDTARYEQDPLTVFFSLRDNTIYVRPVNQNTLIQVDTERGVLIEFPLDVALTLADLNTLGGIELSAQSVVIGEPNSREEHSLLTVLLGDDYRYYWDFHPLTVTLIDVLAPPSGEEAAARTLLFVYDETEQRGQFLYGDWYGVQQMALSPDGTELLIRRSGGSVDERVERYNIDTGSRRYGFIPALRGTGYYTRVQQNRVLAWSQDGTEILSDFQRYSADDGTPLAEDLRYSRRFDRFYFTSDNRGVVTMSGTEWRLWDLASASLTRREVVRLNGDILRTAPDGTRFLTLFDNFDQTGVEIYDVLNNTRETRVFTQLPGHFIEQVVASPDWRHFLVVYSENSYGAYAPGNQVAVYGMDEGAPVWLFAGDDLPPPDDREYGWIDNATAWVRGTDGEQPGRVYGVDYAASGLPACLAERVGDQFEAYSAAWREIQAFVTVETLDQIALAVCDAIQNGRFAPGGTTDALFAIAAGTATPTPQIVSGTPRCLTDRHPAQAEALGATWRQLTDGMAAGDLALVSQLVCEALDETGRLALSGASDFFGVTMFISAATGERSVGDVTEPVNTRPLDPISREFERTEERSPGTIILSPDETMIATSNLPGELVVYRLITPYQRLLQWTTATAESRLATQNVIVAQPSNTPTPGVIGTARPTLTPTVTPTALPQPQATLAMAMAGVTTDFCPSELLYRAPELPPNWSPPGRIIFPLDGESQWVVEPESGRRYPDPRIPQCGVGGLMCDVSPDGTNILAETEQMIFVVKPDGTEARVLFDDDPPEEVFEWPSDIWWSGGNTLEWMVYEQIAGRPEGVFGEQFFRDILGVFPDPPLWYPVFQIEGRSVQLMSRQPGGRMALMYTTFSTGTDTGYRYYLVDTETNAYEYFARDAGAFEPDLVYGWTPYGDRLYYGFAEPQTGRVEQWYVYTPATGERLALPFGASGGLGPRDGRFQLASADPYDASANRLFKPAAQAAGGSILWSPDGRYRVGTTFSRTQPIAVWDAQTGETRTYCLPETGARRYDGQFWWSPDSQYVAMQTFLPADESNPDVGQHILVLKIETGEVVDLTFGGGPIFLWAAEPAEPLQ